MLSSDMLGGGAKDSVKEERLSGISGKSSLASESVSESSRNVETVNVNRKYSYRRKY